MPLGKMTKRQHRLWVLLFAAIALGLGVALILARFLGSKSEPITLQSKIRDAIPVREATTRKVHLYFVTSNGRYLHAEERRVEASDTLSTVEAIIAALLEGPNDPKLVSPIPAGVQLRHLFVTEDGTAYLDFSPELSRLPLGGVTTERLTLYAIVNSLVLNLDAVDRVQLLVEGKVAPTLSGHLDIRHPKTADLLIVH